MKTLVRMLPFVVGCPSCGIRVICPVNDAGTVTDTTCPECGGDLTAALKVRAQAVARRDAAVAERRAIPRPERG